MPPHSFRLLVFDVDGTLVDSQAAIVAAMNRTFDELGLTPPDPASTRRVVGLSLDDAVARLLPADAGPDLIAEAARRYKHAFYAARHEPGHAEPLFPGVAETLPVLDHPQVCLGIATGKSRRGLVATLEHHGLDGHFVTLQTADDGHGKPHPRMLEAAMMDVGAEPAETVLVGDTVFDMEMARSAGTAALGVGWGYHPVADLRGAGAHRILDRFAELPAVLAALSGTCAASDGGTG